MRLPLGGGQTGHHHAKPKPHSNFVFNGIYGLQLSILFTCLVLLERQSQAALLQTMRFCRADPCHQLQAWEAPRLFTSSNGACEELGEDADGLALQQFADRKF